MPAGYDCYYLNIMAGPTRAWHFTIDPDHAWLMDWNPAAPAGGTGGGVRMTLIEVESPLQRMVETTATDYWNDSCAVAELDYAVARGGTGATSNPVIVGEVMKKEKAHWVPRVREIAAGNPTWSETEITWALIEEMGVRGAGILAPVFAREDGRKGRLSLQTNPANYRDPARMTEQALHFSTLAPNIQVKFPTTAAGLQAHRGGDRPGRRRSTRRSRSPWPRRSPSGRPSIAASVATRRRAATRAASARCARS